MSLEDTLRSERIERLRDTADTWFGACQADTERSAMVETAFLMAAADGEISDVEHEQLVGTMVYVTGEQLDPDRVRVLLDQLVEMLQLDGWETRVASVGESIRAPEARRNAYRLAAGVAFVDGHIHPKEMELFALLAEVFEIPLDEASRLLKEVRDWMFGPREEGPDPVILLTPARRRSVQ